MTPAATALLRRWQQRQVPLLLFVSHAHGGGIRRHIDELAAAIGERAIVLLLQPGEDGRHVLHAPGSEGAAIHATPARILEVLAALGVDRLHFHHVHGFDEGILELPAKLGAPYDVTLHDHYPLCPAYHMVDATGRFCGGKPDCHRCDERRESPWPLDIDAWRSTFGRFLQGAGRVIAPSDDCARRFREHLPALAVSTWPHLHRARVLLAPKARVLVPGAISPAKGLDVLAGCVEDARQRNLPMTFRVLGFLARPLPAWPEAPLSVSGEYPEGLLPDLFSRESGDVAFFPAQCPETYSYTVADALDAGLPIVATAIGALPERLRSTPGARIVPHDAPPREINDALLDAAGRRREDAHAPGDAADYVARYLEPVRRRQALPLPALPPLSAQELESPRRRFHDATLAWLYEDGIEAGRASSRQRLQAALPGADAEAAALRGELAQARETLARAEADLAASRVESAGLRASTSWRLTGPLRAVVRALRGR